MKLIYLKIHTSWRDATLLCSRLANLHRVAYGAEGTFVVDVAENKQSNVAFVVDETGDGPQKIANKREGTFDVRVRADLETVERTR